MSDDAGESGKADVRAEADRSDSSMTARRLRSYLAHRSSFDSDVTPFPLILLLVEYAARDPRDPHSKESQPYTQALEGLTHTSWRTLRAFHDFTSIRYLRMPQSLGLLSDAAALLGDQEEIAGDFKIAILKILSEEHPDVLRDVLYRYVVNSREEIARQPRILFAVMELLADLGPSTHGDDLADESQIREFGSKHPSVSQDKRSVRAERRSVLARLERLEKALDEILARIPSARDSTAHGTDAGRGHDKST